MKAIKGLKINHLGFTPVKLGDLLYYEGPLLSHFINENNPDEHFFYRWVDSDDDAHRWLIFKASKNDIKNFFDGKISLNQMIAKNPTVILLDLDDELRKKQILVSTVSELPETYLPATNSRYQEEFYRPYAHQLKIHFETETNENKLLSEVLDKVQRLEKQQEQTFVLLNELKAMAAG